MSRKAPTEAQIIEAFYRHRPPRWRVIWKRGRKFPGEKFKDRTYGYIRGIADFDRNIIECIEPSNFYNLAVFLHECGHVNLGHARDEDGSIDFGAQCEYEAEKYAIEAMRAMGFPVPRKYVKDARNYVRDCIEEAPDVQHSDEVLKFAYGKQWRKFT